MARWLIYCTKENMTLRPKRGRQSELQAIIDLSNRAETLSTDVRRRLEAGAEFESGKWGVDIVAHAPRSECRAWSFELI
jgi:hypothetical protein